MKLNFWQILGAVLLVIGLIFILRRELAGSDGPAPGTNVSATAPAVP